MIVRSMSSELEYIVKKIVEKYKINGLKEPLLNQQNIAYLMWRIKGFIWHAIGKEIDPNLDCDMALFADRLFDEISSLSDEWLELVMNFNSECLQYIQDKKIIEMLIDMLILGISIMNYLSHFNFLSQYFFMSNFSQLLYIIHMLRNYR